MILAASQHGPVLARVAASAAPRAATGIGRDELFRGLYDEHARFVWRCVRRLGVAPASLDDAVQDVFLVVHRRLDEYEPRGAHRTWLYAIAVRVARDFRRAAARKGGLAPLDERVADPAPDPLEAAAKSEGARLLESLLEQLDDERREVLVLADLEGMAMPEIAEVLGVNANTLYSRLRAARADFERLVARARRSL